MSPMFLLTLRDLQFRAVRFGIAIVGTALVFAMVLLMSGLSAQFHKEPEQTVEKFGAQSWIVPEGVSGPFTSGATMPVRDEDPNTADETLGELTDRIADASGGRADPLAFGRHTASLVEEPETDDKKDVLLVGHVVGGIGSPEVDPGGSSIDSTGQVVVTEESTFKVGETIWIGGNSFSVRGLTHRMTVSGGTPLLFMDIADVQDLMYSGQELATVIVSDAAVDAPEGYRTLEAKQVSDDAFRPLAKPISAIDVVQILLWLVAATIIGAVVYLSALERRRDFAVMKAVGASSRGLLGGLATQSVLIALVAAVVATGIQFALTPFFPIPVQVPVSAYIRLPILALLAGALASLGGLRKAVNVDPALAFAGPGG